MLILQQFGRSRLTFLGRDKLGHNPMPFDGKIPLDMNGFWVKKGNNELENEKKQ